MVTLLKVDVDSWGDGDRDVEVDVADAQLEPVVVVAADDRLFAVYGRLDAIV